MLLLFVTRFEGNFSYVDLNSGSGRVPIPERRSEQKKQAKIHIVGY